MTNQAFVIFASVHSPTVSEGYLKDVLIGFGDAVASSAEVAFAYGLATDALRVLRNARPANAFVALPSVIASLPFTKT
jgi:hypothetical protein